MESIRVIGYCKCCADEIEAVRRLSGEAIEPAVTIIARAVIDEDTGAEGIVAALLMSDGSSAISFDADRIIVAPIDAVAPAIIQHSIEIQRVIFSDSAPEQTRELVESLMGAR